MNGRCNANYLKNLSAIMCDISVKGDIILSRGGEVQEIFANKYTGKVTTYSATQNVGNKCGHMLK